MLHQKSIHQSKLLQALYKKRMTKTPTDQPIEEYYPVISESIPEPELASVSEPIQVQEKLLPIQELEINAPIMHTGISEAKKKSSIPTFPFPSDFEFPQKKYFPVEESETAKLFEEYEQFKYEQNLWNKLHGK
jgi:hypothetical protein